MKKFLSLVAVLGLFAAYSAFGGTASITLTGGATGNLLTNIGPFKLTSISIQASTATNTSVVIYDSPTNGQTAVFPAYTNTLTVPTNLITLWTNFFGYTNTVTNLVILDITNNLVAASTNQRTILFTAAAAASSTVVQSPLSLPVIFGLYFTNTVSPGTAVINVQYTQ